MRLSLLLLPLLAAPFATAQPAPGSCAPGTAEAVLDGNDVTARLFNGGNLFFGNTSRPTIMWTGPRSSSPRTSGLADW